MNGAGRTNASATAMAESILGLAAGEAWTAGDRLPTERQLAEDLGTSRAAVRQALAVLEADGRISREVGRGTFLSEPRRQVPETDQSDDFGPADVMAVRCVLEPEAMAMVVARATTRDLEEMQRCLIGGDAATTYTEFERWDLALHRSFIEATHNPLLLRLYLSVESARHGHLWGELKRRNDSDARRAQYRQQHTAVVEALRMRDSSRAVRAMRAHLAAVERNLLGTVS
jgi:GntR family uxuAB operon transcriptional repressor